MGLLQSKKYEDNDNVINSMYFNYTISFLRFTQNRMYVFTLVLDIPYKNSTSQKFAGLQQVKNNTRG